MSNSMKKALALMMALLMMFAVVACAKEDAEPSDSDTSETTTAPTNNDDDTPPSDENSGNNNQGDQNTGDNNEGETPPAPTPVTPPVTLVENGTAKFIVVSAGDAYDTLAEELATALTEKTGTPFITKNKISSSECALYVGKSPKTVMQNDYAELTYNGFLVRSADRHIHLTGHTLDTVKAATDYLVSSIADDAKDQDTITVPGSVLDIHNPEMSSYPYRNATLLGAKLSDYVIVLPKEYTIYDRNIADRLIDQIGNDTGYKLEYYKDSNKNSNVTYQIVIGKTSRAYSTTVYEGLATDTYRVQSNGTCVYLAYENYMVASDSMKKFCEVYRENPTTVNATETMDFSGYLIDRPQGANLRLMSNNVTVVQDAASYEAANDITYLDRMDILSEMYLKYMPDFIGLQEMQYSVSVTTDHFDGKVDMYTALQERIGHKYEMLGDTDNMEVIFYQKEVWQLETDADDNPICGEGKFNAMHLWNWGLFSRVDNPEIKVIIMDVHYAGTTTLYNTSDKNNGQNPAYNGLNNGEVINIIYQELYETYAGVPIFIMGDFNSKYNETGSWPLTFNSTIKDTTLDSVSRILRDENGAPTAAWGGGYTETTLNHSMFTHPIDHILLPTDKADAVSYRFINEGLMGISSGHRPIMADIYVKPVTSGGGNGLGWGSGTTPQN